MVAKMEDDAKTEKVNGIASETTGKPNHHAETTVTRYATQAIQLLGEGKLHAALQCLNHCLGDSDDTETSDLEIQLQELIKERKASNAENSSNESEDFGSDASSLIEKRCLVNMRLKRYNKVVHDAKKMLDFSGENSVAYKCLLTALCKMKKLEQANEVIRLWQRNSPRDLEMMECRTKLESLMVAVKNGIEPSDAFSDVEELLGLNYDWLILRKSKDPQWKFRPLPASSRCSFVLCLQYRFGHCSLGEKCPDAHGELELEEWKKRFEIENISRKISSMKVDDGTTYIKDLLAKIQLAKHTSSVVCEDDTEQVKVTCSSPLHTTVQQRKFKKFTWKFNVKTVKPLTNICLLHDHHRQYFHVSSCSFVGPNDSIVLNQGAKAETSSQVVSPHLSEAALAIAGANPNLYTYKVKVVFTPEVYGNFRQTVVFDIGEESRIIRNVAVDVVPPPDADIDSNRGGSSNDRSSSPIDRSKLYRTNIPWNFGNADMVDGNSGEKMASEKLGFALISGAAVSKPESFMENTKDPLSKEHYKDRMRFLLTQEERSRQEILAKYNVRTNVYMSEKYVVSGGYNEGMTRYAIDGALFGRISLFRDISEDTAVGRLILRSCNAVLLTKSEELRKKEATCKIRVYFCPISDKTKNSVFMDLGKTSVSELDLKDGDVIQFDIQFQLDRTAFIEQKRVIDRLEEKHLRMLFPDLAINCNIPWSPIKQWSEIEHSEYRLNPKQKESLIAITAEDCKTPPILVIGPFGTGKTFTLAQCIRKILTQKDTRVMVCTHSNSAADLYIKEYLDSWVKEGFTAATPLRIYYEMRNLSSVHPTVLQYCKIEAMKFRPPSFEEVLEHRVIVVTLSTSYLLMEMNLPEDTFSHILLDEAAQAMESEAITPLMSAGQDTKLVLAGDHMQLSPELFSEEARNIHPSLLERLHVLYPDAHPCKLMLCENYRSHSSIIQFVSDSFYTKKLECAKSQPVHDNFFPLTFFAARGEDIQESESTSYYNMAEVFELTEKISELISSWPGKWGDYRDESAIGVLTPYADQVTRIRSRLRKKGLHSVSVERVFNVQGKQFRAVFLSTVRSFRPWVRILPEAVGNEVDLGFFSSPKLLNTALTRAQSLVAVVGDPVSLCSVGKCRRIWEDYIRICNDSKSLFGITFLQLKQSILGVEMRLTWGLNPLANEFQPQSKQSNRHVTSSAPSSVLQNNIPYPTISINHPRFNMIRQTRPQYFYADGHGAYYGPQPHVPELNMLPNQLGHLQNPAFFHAPPQQTGLVRQPYMGGIGIVPPFPPYVPPPVSPWTQGMVPPMQLPSAGQNVPWSNASVPPIRTAPSRPVQYPSTPTLHYPSPPVQANNSTELVSQQNVSFMNAGLLTGSTPTVDPFLAARNLNPPVKAVLGGSTTQQQFAAGIPLYRRAAATNHPNSVPSHTLPQSSYEERPSGSHPNFDQYAHHNSQPKLTQEELNFITRALDHHAASGEPFFGDMQSLRTKLMQSVSDCTSIRQPFHGQLPQSTRPPAPHSTENFPQNYASTNVANSGMAGAVFAPIPQKSPVIQPDRYVYPNYPESSAAATLSNRTWSASNNVSFPSLTEGVVSSSAVGYHPQHSVITTSNDGIQRKPTMYLDSSGRPVYPEQYSTMSNAPANSLGQTSASNRPLGSYNNNSTSSKYEYGYHADVGGLKAQLSGGLRQGFGERSAFSRVNGNQDVDVAPDNSGLGRSYANVVKAAVTAAVGSGVSTSTLSIASNVSRLPTPLGPVSNPFANNPRFYAQQGASSHSKFCPP